MTAPHLDRPLPHPTELSAPFWDAARSHELVRPVCEQCSHNFFTPALICPACLSEQWSYRISSGLGTVYSATVVHRAPFPALPAPYQLAIVDMDEGWSLLTNIVESGDRPARIGARVQVTWVDIDEHWTFPAFRVTQTRTSR